MEPLPFGFVKSFKALEIGPNKIFYEDNYIIVKRKDNCILQIGKLIKLPYKNEKVRNKKHHK